MSIYSGPDRRGPDCGALNIREQPIAMRGSRGPRKLTRIFLIFTKDARRGLSGMSSGMSPGREELWEAQARELVELRAQQNGLPIYELGPEFDHPKVIPRLPDANYLCHRVREEFGPQVTDRLSLSSTYPAARLREIAKLGPPEIRAMYGYD